MPIDESSYRAWDGQPKVTRGVAFAIAATKASLVVLFFMHVKGSTSMIKMSAVGGFFWLLIFGAFVLADVLTRPGMLEFL